MKRLGDGIVTSQMTELSCAVQRAFISILLNESLDCSKQQNRTIMKIKMIICFALAAGLLIGCINLPAKVETEKAGQKTGKAIVSADQVPDAVKQALQTKFLNVNVAEWKIKPDKIYEAEFTLKGIEITVMFDSAGKWLETESAIDPARVPKVVSDAAAKQFKGYKVIETQSVERWNEQNLIYELHFENAIEIAKAQFSSEGAILSQSAKVKP
jgi:hypothetical protein